jgi:predicted DCC family thiol-disulfide oxidoreductase YuxK
MVNNQDILLIDEQCALCSRAVEFILNHGGGDKFSFLSIFSEEGKLLLSANGLPRDYDKSLVLIETGKVFTKSAAALRVARRLSGLYPALYFLMVVPKPIRDAVYDMIAKHRHRFN